MRKIVFITIMLLAAMLVCTCKKQPLMEETSRRELPHLDKVLVTFIRSTVMAPATKAGLWDRDTFVGELRVRSYIQYETTPGKHLFMANSEVWSYVVANLQGGRHYIIKAEVVPGGNSPRIHLAPLSPGGRTTQADVDHWFEKLDGYKPTKEESEKYVLAHRTALEEAIRRYDDGRATYETLSPGDAW